jgi:hypothetical protein
MRTSILPQHSLTERRFRFPGRASTPQQLNLSHFGPFLAPGTSQNSGQKSPSPAASTGGRSGQSGTLQETTGGTQTHSRRTGSKLRQLPCARQGLVRVPESNTKYGGKAGKTGVVLRPLCCQVSVSPQGFPSEKNCLERANLSFAPLFTGQLFIVAEGLPRRDSGEAIACPGWHARLRMAWRPDNRHGAADSTGPVPS